MSLEESIEEYGKLFGFPNKETIEAYRGNYDKIEVHIIYPIIDKHIVVLRDFGTESEIFYMSHNILMKILEKNRELIKQ